MRKGGGKNKGSEFERKIAKKLSLWWTEEKRDDIFWLTAGSGARATVRAKNGVETKYQYGDISFIDPEGKSLVDYFLIELKTGYPDLGIMLLIDGKQKNPVLVKWWNKAENEKEFGKRKATILIIKRDYKHPIIVFDQRTFSKIESYAGVWKKDIISIYLTAIKRSLVVIPLYPFLEYCSSETIRLFIKDSL